MAIIDFFKVAFQYIIPQHGISLLMGRLAESRWPPLKNAFIRWFANQYQISLDEAEVKEFEKFACFNDFFTRALEKQARPIDDTDSALVCPVDGAVSQLGRIEEGRIFQAKGHHYTTLELLGGNQTMADTFHNGHFATIYLAPSDYHRIHMPCEGKLTAMSHIPGKLFSVNPLTARKVPKLFARNERVVAYFDTEFGPLAMVAVGATIVGSVETIWSGTVTPPSRKEVRSWQYDDEAAITIGKGEEMGRFKLGSTVILLLPEQALSWEESMKAESTTRLGELLATIKK